MRIRDLLAVLFLCASSGCPPTPPPDGDDSLEEEREVESDQQRLERLKNEKGFFQITLPPEPRVGQWYEYTAGSRVTRMSIVRRTRGQFIVERVRVTPPSKVVEAWQVDPAIDLTVETPLGEPTPLNVTRCWVGLEGQAPFERGVIAARLEHGPDSEDEQSTRGRETVRLAGREWSTDWVENEDGKSWYVRGTVFLLRLDSKSFLTSVKLTGCGEGAAPRLEWGGTLEQD